MFQKRLLPFLISGVVGFVFCFIFFDAYASSIASIAVWILLWIGLTFLLFFIEQKSRKGFVFGIAALLIVSIAFNMVKTGHLLPRSLIQPTPNEIALQFTEALITGNEEEILALTDGSAECQMLMLEAVQLLEQEVEQRHGSEWRTQELGKIDIGLILFNRDPLLYESFNVLVYQDDDVSPYLVFSLRTTYDEFGNRYTCGQELSL